MWTSQASGAPVWLKAADAAICTGNRRPGQSSPLAAPGPARACGSHPPRSLEPEKAATYPLLPLIPPHSTIHPLPTGKNVRTGGSVTASPLGAQQTLHPLGRRGRNPARFLSPFQAIVLAGALGPTTP